VPRARLTRRDESAAIGTAWPRRCCNRRRRNASPGDAHSRRFGRGVRRYRNQPFIRIPGIPSFGSFGTRPGARCARRGIADPLVAHPHHLAEIRDTDLSRGQSWRRRDRRTAGGLARTTCSPRHLALRRAHARSAGSCVALRGRSNHARHLGPERSRRTKSRCAVIGTRRHSNHPGGTGRLVSGAAPRNRSHWQHFRTDHAVLVLGDRSLRAPRHRHGAGHSRRV